MRSWPTRPLGEIITETQYGTAERANEAGRGLPVLRMNNITNDGHLALADLKWVELDDAERARLLLQPGDLLFNRTNSRELVGKTAVWKGAEPFTFAGYLIRVRLREDLLLPDFLSAYLNSPRGKRVLFHAAKPSINMANISASDLLRIEVPVPPLEHQKRVLPILDKADAIRRKRKEAIALTEDLLRSTFLEMFGDPVTNPKDWPVHKLGKIIQRFEAGTSVGGEPRQRDTEGLGVLKISAVTSGVFLPHEHKAVPPDLVPSSLVVPRRGDLLFSRANTRELVAATCLVETDDDHLFLPDKLWRVVTSDAVKNEYLRYLFGHPGFRGHLTKRATGTSGSMLNVSMEKVNGLDAPVPSKSLQERFARLVWRTYDLRRQLSVAHAEAEALFASLVHRAFRGELTAPATRSPSRNPKQLSLLKD